MLQTASKYELHSNHLCSLEEWARSELHANHLCSLQEWARSIYIKNHTGHYTFRAMHTRPYHTRRETDPNRAGARHLSASPVSHETSVATACVLPPRGSWQLSQIPSKVHTLSQQRSCTEDRCSPLAQALASCFVTDTSTTPHTPGQPSCACRFMDCCGWTAAEQNDLHILPVDMVT